MGTSLYEDTLGTMAWRGWAACLASLLAISCSSSNSSARKDPPALDIQTSPSTLLRVDRQDLVSLRGHLVHPATGGRITLDEPVFVVAVSDLKQEVNRPKPPVITRDEQGFSPKLSVVPVGARIRFDNRDQIFHSFFATAPGNEFDLDPLDPGNSAFIRFQKPGLVHVYCRLHSGHRTSILILPSASYARVDTEGRFRIDGLAPGRYALELWSQDMPRTKMDVLVKRDQAQTIEFAVESLPAKAGR